MCGTEGYVGILIVPLEIGEQWEAYFSKDYFSLSKSKSLIPLTPAGRARSSCLWERSKVRVYTSKFLTASYPRAKMRLKLLKICSNFLVCIVRMCIRFNIANITILNMTSLL